jgi:hypothetical protein
MSWIKQNDNLYIHDQAPYSLVLSNGTWFVIDNRDQSKAIPFDDILSNPVFPANFSNETILAKHFRGQATGDLASPPHSFQGEINSGLYRESAGVLAFAVLGNKVLEINSKPSFLPKAWINFNGTGTVEIRGSGNISSITDNGTGDFTLNFTVAMVDTNYISIGSGQEGSGFADGTVFVRIGAKSTGNVRISVANFTQTALQDVPRNDVIILR